MKPKTCRVLKTLYTASEQCRNDGWVCGRTLAHPKVGGWKKDARLHEIRQAGFVLEKRVCYCDQCTYFTDKAKDRGEHLRIFAFRLAPDTRAKDVEKALAA